MWVWVWHAPLSLLSEGERPPAPGELRALHTYVHGSVHFFNVKIDRINLYIFRGYGANYVALSGGDGEPARREPRFGQHQRHVGRRSYA